MKKLFLLFCFWPSLAFAQSWQVPIGNIPYGKGRGVVGFGSITNTGAGVHCLINTQPPTFAPCPGSGGGSGTVTSIIAGTGLSGGTITSAGTLSVIYGTASGTAAQGNDSRILGALQAASNLADLASAGTARTNLGLGSIATQAASAVTITGGSITGLSNPTIGSEAANKAYVDSIAVGLTIKAAVKYGTTTALAANTYANGASGVGATLTGNANGAISLDGSTPSAADRVLIKNEAAAESNGCYTVTTVGSGGAAYVLTRCTDLDTAGELVAGSAMLITAGSTLANTGWALSGTVTTVGTTAVNFAQYAGASQWFNSGADIYYSAGKVGVGTSSPGDLVSIVGGALTLTKNAPATSGNILLATDNTVGPLIGSSTDGSGNATAAVAASRLLIGASGIQFQNAPNPGIGSPRVWTRQALFQNSSLFVGDTAIVPDTNSSNFLSINNSTAHAFSEVGAGGNATTAGDYVGILDFFNSSLGSSEKRIAAIAGRTSGATNTGLLEFSTWNAGTITATASMSPGRTNIIGDVAVNADYATATDITSNLNTQLGARSYIQLPCGTFSISSTLNFAIAGQTLAGSGNCTILKNTYNGAAYQGLISIISINSVTVRDLEIDMDSKGAVAFCIDVEHSSYVRILNVRCRNSLNGGFTFSQIGAGVAGSNYGLIQGCYMENIANVAATNAHAIELSYSDFVVVSGCNMQNVDNGVNVALSNYVSVSGLSINGSGLTNSGFAGLRCTDGTGNLSASGISMTNVPRGLFLLGCTSSSFSSISITNTQYQAILIAATNVPGPPTSTPTQGNSLSGITIVSSCVSAVCNAGVELAAISVAANSVTNNVMVGVNVINVGGSGPTAFLLNGVTPGLNKCDPNNNIANLTYGSC